MQLLMAQRLLEHENAVIGNDFSSVIKLGDLLNNDIVYNNSLRQLKNGGILRQWEIFSRFV